MLVRVEYKIIEGMLAHAFPKRSIINPQSSQEEVLTNTWVWYMIDQTIDR